jgi:hypothetical protein
MNHVGQLSARELFWRWLEEVVELGGIEPPTSTLPVLRSPS